MPCIIQPIFQADDVDDCEPRRNEIRASIKKARFRDEETFFDGFDMVVRGGAGRRRHHWHPRVLHTVGLYSERNMNTASEVLRYMSEISIGRMTLIYPTTIWL
jgi:hypothetical protein